MPLVLGAIGATNTWDLPTYLGIGVLAWLLGEWLARGRIRILRTILFTLYLAGASILLYLPFYSHYTTVFNTGVALTYAKTDMGTWLRIWGFFMFAAISFLLAALVARPGRVATLAWLSGLYGADASLAQKQMSAGIYYVAVDGYNGAAGAFTLVSHCTVHFEHALYLPMMKR